MSRARIKQLADWAHNKLSIPVEDTESISQLLLIRFAQKDGSPTIFWLSIAEMKVMIDAGEFNDSTNPLEKIAQELIMHLIDKINTNNITEKSTLVKSS
ncbi:hypothetical protein A3206_01680 [Candidatus Methanomassiliicoccus intestinalis]|nr:MAG: hypothetical protein A3206_01680 [Candidatus Methanomassiliicoccus intestinalis]